MNEVLISGGLSPHRLVLSSVDLIIVDLIYYGNIFVIDFEFRAIRKVDLAREEKGRGQSVVRPELISSLFFP